jgi:hypothetical protein
MRRLRIPAAAGGRRYRLGLAEEIGSGAASGLRLIVRALPTGSVASRHREPSEPDVVHDHIRPCERQIAAITCIGVRVGARHVINAGTVERGETVGGPSGSSQLSPGRGSTEMINDGCSDSNGKVLVKGVGENLPPTAQAWTLGRPDLPVAAPGT